MSGSKDNIGCKLLTRIVSRLFDEYQTTETSNKDESFRSLERERAKGSKSFERAKVISGEHKNTNISQKLLVEIAQNIFRRNTPKITIS